ncbi:MAG: glycosyltransferase family 2 protein, partial [Candidatus Roizmanbacteria bacterium]|nr:glycosyltransferase family 2 protein [Candidatus Roizmanbacteria bacterium]
MDKKPLVSIVIVNWNGMRFLKDCLESLKKARYPNREIIFVDNASADESVAFVKKNYPEMKIIQNTENLGYAEGHEKAIQQAKGSLVLLLSTDTILEQNVLEELVKGIYSEKNIGCVMPKLVMHPQKDKIDSVGSFFIQNGMTYHYGREKNPRDAKYNKKMFVYTAKGACLLFKASVLKKIGLFDKDFFAYFEETDLCHRVWLSGNKVLYWPYCFVYHKGGGASGQMVSSFIQFHSYKNRICAYLKNLSAENLVWVLPQLFLIYQITSLVHVVIGRFGVAGAVQKAIWWNIF